MCALRAYIRLKTESCNLIGRQGTVLVLLCCGVCGGGVLVVVWHGVEVRKKCVDKPLVPQVPLLTQKCGQQLDASWAAIRLKTEKVRHHREVGLVHGGLWRCGVVRCGAGVT